LSGQGEPRFSAQLARTLLGEDGIGCLATKDLDETTIKKLRAAAAKSAPDATSVK
jgi:hypothetical protein